MEDFELEYDVQEVRLSKSFAYKVTTVANEALPLEMLLELETRREEISGQRLWEGSMLLCANLLEASSCNSNSGETHLTPKGKTVLELGAGTGLVSMLAHGLGASLVVTTDGDEKCVEMVKKNFEDNGIPARGAFAAPLRWGDAESAAAFHRAYGEWRDHSQKQAASTESGSGMPGSVPKPSGDRTLLGNRVKASERFDESFARGASPSAGCNEESACLFQVLLAGDVLYKLSVVATFLQTVEEMMAPDGYLLLCHLPRAGVSHEVVQEALEQASFTFRVLDLKGALAQEADGVYQIGGVDLCPNDARRARLYVVRRKD